MKIEIYTIGYRSVHPLKCGWSAMLVATAEDGRKKNKHIYSLLDTSYTKNQVDVISIIKALQCVKPRFRAEAEVILYAPQGYAITMLERNADDIWTSIPKSNITEVNTARMMLNGYSRLTVSKISTSSLEYRQILGNIQNLKVPVEA